MRGGTRRLPRISAGVVAGTLILALAACDEGPSEPGPSLGEGEASLSVYLKDAPGDVANVWVEVVDVVLIGGEGGPRSLLDEPSSLIDLLALQDDILTLVDGEEVEAGSYQQIRFVVGGAVLESTDGQVFVRDGAEHPDGLETTGNLQCPSCGQTGIKVRFPGSLDLEEGEHGLLLDFDVAESFGRQAGQSGMWVMRPSIQGARVEPGEVESGDAVATIRGWVELGEDDEGDPVVLPECGDRERGLDDFVPAAVSTSQVDDEGEPFRFSGATTPEGDFAIEALVSDTYELTYRDRVVLNGQELVWTAVVEPETVEASKGEEATGIVYTVLEAACQATD